MKRKSENEAIPENQKLINEIEELGNANEFLYVKIKDLEAQLKAERDTKQADKTKELSEAKRPKIGGNRF